MELSTESTERTEEGLEGRAEPEGLKKKTHTFPWVNPRLPAKYLRKGMKGRLDAAPSG